MWRRGCAIFVFLAIFPLTASAATIDELRAHLATLVAQLTALQQQQQYGGSGMITNPASCPTFFRNLYVGVRGDDVVSLQRFLIGQGLLGSESATGYFGPLTEAAVKRFQSGRGVVSSRTPGTTGFGGVGSRTRNAILAICTTSLPPPLPPPL